MALALWGNFPRNNLPRALIRPAGSSILNWVLNDDEGNSPEEKLTQRLNSVSPASFRKLPVLR